MSLVFLGEAVLRLLRVLSPDAGCLLVLEDLHWADGETLALLEYLADNLSAERVLCVGTLRDRGRRRGGRTGQHAGGARIGGRAAAGPAGSGGGGPHGAGLRRRAIDLPDAVQSLVAERAEGLPFLVEEVLAALIGDGTLAERDGGWHAAALARTGLPATFADAVLRAPGRPGRGFAPGYLRRRGAGPPFRLDAAGPGHRPGPGRLWWRRCGAE